jgi:hypothetical protein
VKLQTWKKALITGTSLALLASTACQSSETKSYAKQLKLPREVLTTVRQLEYDAITRSLLDELSHFPKDLQTHEVTLNYLKEVSKDKTVSYDEVSGIKRLDHDGDGLNLEEENELKTDPLQPNPGIKKVVDYLKSVSDETLDIYKRLGIDGDVVPYINLVSTLPKDFADYAIKSKLCIQDKKLTDLERKFLKEPDKYLQELYDYHISEISKIDPELTAKVGQLPYLKDKPDIKAMEVLEDILYLASNSQNQSKLGKIYGKGIERKMWPVALERVFYKGFGNEFDINNPFEGSEWYVNSNLAEFQEKYNKEMDIEGVSGPKPAILGVGLLHEPLGYLIKSENDTELDYALIRWALRCNAVRLYCIDYIDDYDVFHHAKIAQDEGLDVWLHFFPLFNNSNISSDEFKQQLSDISKKSQEQGIKGLMVSSEVDIWWNKMGGDLGHSTVGHAYRNNGDLSKFVDELVQIARQNYSGLVTYCDWWASGLRGVNWAPMDMVSQNIYYHSAYDQYFADYVLQMKSQSKPLIISETGSLTISEADDIGAGGDFTYVINHNVHHDPEKQVRVIDKELNVFYSIGVHGIFVHVWDEPALGQQYDKNKLGFGIWDYVKKEPKPSFWIVYKYYKE